MDSTVGVTKKELETLKKYCSIFHWTPKILISEMVLQIRKQIPHIDEMSMDELRQLSDSVLAVKVIMEQKGDV